MTLPALPVALGLAFAFGLAACVPAAQSPPRSASAGDGGAATAGVAPPPAVDGLTVVGFDLVRADGVTAAVLEHVEARTWRVTFPGLNARTAQVSGRSECCVTFSDFDFLGVSSFDVVGPDIGGTDRVGVRADNLVGRSGLDETDQPPPAE